MMFASATVNIHMFFWSTYVQISLENNFPTEVLQLLSPNRTLKNNGSTHSFFKNLILKN